MNNEKVANESVDPRKAKPESEIPVRSLEATSSMVDLTAYYNMALDDNIHHKSDNTFSSLPKGIQKLGGKSFDLRGVIQLSGAKSLEITGVIYPEAISGIPVHTKGKQLHFIHGTAWDTPAGTKIGEYVLHYSSGQQVILPLIFQHNIIDWWDNPADPADQLTSDTQVVWRGANPRSLERGYGLRLVKYTATNPFPDIEIKTMDFKSDLVVTAPFLVAATIE